MKPKQQMQQMTTAQQAGTMEFHSQIIFTFMMFKLTPHKHSKQVIHIPTATFT